MTGGQPPPALHGLLGVLEAHAPAAAVSWLRRGLPSIDGPLPRGIFFGFYAGAGRRFGHGSPALDPIARERLIEAGLERPSAYSLSDVARAALLVGAMACVPDGEQLSLAQEAFRKGDNAERAALLRALSLLPRPERFVELAAEASRTHVHDVFEALAADNPYPARWFPELNWNQLVMKALFTGVALERVIGWQARNNPELLRMAADYAAERRAAGRPVPEDVERIRARSGSPQDEPPRNAAK
jgi:hypothetical protein